MSSRPISVIAIGIIGIITSGFTLVLTALGIVFLFKPVFSSPLTDELGRDAGYFVITLVTSTVVLLLSVALIVLSIAALKFKPWARKGIIVYAWLMIAYTLLNLVPTYGYVIPKLSVIANSPRFVNTAEGSIAVMAAVLTSIISAFYNLVLPVAILICFRRRVVVEAFAGVLPAAPVKS